MKALIAVAILLAVSITLTYGQCDKKSVLKSSKTEYLGADSSVQRSMDETAVVEFDQNKMKVSISGDQPREINGTMKDVKCSWTTPYKDGKTVMKGELVDPDGDTRNVTITIEGKNGKVNFLVVLDDQPDRRIRLNVDSYEEKK